MRGIDLMGDLVGMTGLLLDLMQRRRGLIDVMLKLIRLMLGILLNPVDVMDFLLGFREQLPNAGTVETEVCHGVRKS